MNIFKCTFAVLLASVIVISHAHAEVIIEGTASYKATHTSRSISLSTQFQYVSNYNYSDTSSMKLVVSCLKSKYTGGSASGRTVARKTLGVIPARSYFKNVKASGSATYSGKCYVTAFLVDSSNAIYYGRSFTKTVNVKKLILAPGKREVLGSYSESF